jgi:hypothetical protein
MWVAIDAKVDAAVDARCLMYDVVGREQGKYGNEMEVIQKQGLGSGMEGTTHSSAERSVVIYAGKEHG